jgi:hypothetical protein
VAIDPNTCNFEVGVPVAIPIWALLQTAVAIANARTNEFFIPVF